MNYGRAKLICAAAVIAFLGDVLQPSASAIGAAAILLVVPLFFAWAWSVAAVVVPPQGMNRWQGALMVTISSGLFLALPSICALRAAGH